jgi:hypothetical protein
VAPPSVSSGNTGPGRDEGPVELGAANKLQRARFHIYQPPSQGHPWRGGVWEVLVLRLSRAVFDEATDHQRFSVVRSRSSYPGGLTA